MQAIRSCLIAAAIVLAGCNNEKPDSELAQRNRELEAELTARNDFIEEVTASIHEVHNRLESVWAKERNLIRTSASIEDGKALSPTEVKDRTLKRIAEINDILSANRKRLNEIQRQLTNSRMQYTGLQKIVDDLNTRLREREESVASLQQRVMSLESDVSDKVKVIAARDGMIADQANELENVFWAAGTEEELEDSGVITQEGGFLWGLLGSTTVLSANFPPDKFSALNRVREERIEVNGTVVELVPKRDETSYETESVEDGKTVVKIINPEVFWRQKHLAVVTQPSAHH